MSEEYEYIRSIRNRVRFVVIVLAVLDAVLCFVLWMRSV
jgi:hypothetical protein